VHFTSITQTLSGVKDEPLPGLEILHAGYGQFMPQGIADITEIMRGQIHDGHINVQTGNELAGGDPCFGIPKSTRVTYTVGGKEHTVTVQEHAPLILPRPGESGELIVTTAFYGNIPASFCGKRAPKPTDVTEQLKTRIDAGHFTFNAGEIYSGDFTMVEGLGDPKLHIIYKVGGEVHEGLYAADAIIDMRRHKDEPRVVIEDGKPYWLTPASGEVTLTDTKGQTLHAHVGNVPEPVAVDGSWQVHFSQKWGKEWDAKLPRLFPLNESEQDDIRYFSGTAVYTSTFTLPKDYLSEDLMLELRLGQVFVIAELFVNGEDMGILWHEPYSKDITNALKAGANTIEVRVTNQWINRLIGDERLPQDFKQEGVLYTEWPEWMQHPEGRTSGRTTFAAWKHWGAEDALQPSGLVGPVVIKPYAKVRIEH